MPASKLKTATLIKTLHVLIEPEYFIIEKKNTYSSLQSGIQLWPLKHKSENKHLNNYSFHSEGLQRLTTFVKALTSLWRGIHERALSWRAKQIRDAYQQRECSVLIP